MEATMADGLGIANPETGDTLKWEKLLEVTTVEFQNQKFDHGFHGWTRMELNHLLSRHSSSARQQFHFPNPITSRRYLSVPICVTAVKTCSVHRSGAAGHGAGAGDAAFAVMVTPWRLQGGVGLAADRARAFR